MEDMEEKLRHMAQALSEDALLPGSPTEGGITIGEAIKKVQDAQLQIYDTLRIIDESREQREKARKSIEETRTKHAMEDYYIFIDSHCPGALLNWVNY